MQKRYTERDVKLLTGLMSLFSELMKSSLLTSSFSAVSMFTSTVLVAYNKHNVTQIELANNNSYLCSLANESHYMKYCTVRLHNVSADNVLPQSRKVRPSV